MLGIDTGGTYTDAVIVDGDTGQVLHSAKALTTPDDLSRGIDAAIAALPAEGLSRVNLVGLSTTLATNALVEGKGGRVGLILIGYDPRLIERWGFQRDLVTDLVIFIRGGHDLHGREVMPLDEAALQEAVHQHMEQVDAWAISGYFGVRNPDHEQHARDVVRAISQHPVTCAHELSGELNAIRRATTAVLNARLIPLIHQLIRAVQRSLARRGISAPLMVVRGDGALLRSEAALNRPVDTILSGPAASIVGARYLTGLDEAIVVDMGGTTTDIAILKRGRPAIREDGAQVGGWRTLVRAVDAQTTGLGGDSRIQVKGQRLQVGPERAVPLSLTAARYPSILQELAKRRSGRSLPEIVLLVGDTPTWEMTKIEREIVEALRDGPASLDRLEETIPLVRVYLGRPNRLERHGIIRRAAFTPTDALHVLGIYQAWDAEMAQRGAAALGEPLGLSPVRFSQLVHEQVMQRLAIAILDRLLASEDADGGVMSSSPSRLLVERALGYGGPEGLDVHIRLCDPIIAVGAPVAAYFERVAAWLGAELIIPDHAEVANAIGAVSGSVMHTCEVRIVAQYEVSGITAYTLHSAAGMWTSDELEEALAFAREHGRALATAGARAAGAGEVQIEEEEREERAVTSWGGNPLYLGTRLRFTAIGRPNFQDDYRRKGKAL